MSGALSIGGKQIFSHSDVTDKVTYGSGVPAGTVIQTKILKESDSYGSFGSQGDTYTGISIAFDNNLSSTNSTVLIESSIQYDIAHDTGIGFTWATSSSTLSGNKIGVDGSNITNFSKNTPYINASRHGDTISFLAYDTNITSTTPKTYYLWLNNAYPSNLYINYHVNLSYAAQIGTGSYWTGSATSVFKLTEIAG